MAKIESYINPSSLYRYRSLRDFDREINAIESASLHCAAYSDLNDPMEGLYSSTVLQRKSKHFEEIRAIVADKQSAHGICSFSEVNNNELMWAHYANEFRGICIGYSFGSLLSRLPDDVEFVRLNYSEKAPTLQTLMGPVHSARRALSCKSYKWLYEREWRMFARQGLSYYNDVHCVRTVYLGSRIDPKNATIIKQKMDRLNIEVKEMQLDVYSVTFKTLRRRQRSVPGGE